MSSLDFYFDFSSSYSYVAHTEVEALAKRQGWEVNWIPISLGVIFQSHGHAIPTQGTAKQRYLWRDVERSAAAQGMPYQWPKPFPFNSIPLARGFLWLQRQDPAAAKRFAHTLFQQLYAEGGNTGDPAALLQRACESISVVAADMTEAIQGDDIKGALKTTTAEAMARGVFGAPTFAVGDELFWGADRLLQLEQHLKKAG
ncbi:MAG: 2-hydroxychromene-2-carboxylate isomerase [Parahaliea sp.]